MLRQNETKFRKKIKPTLLFCFSIFSLENRHSCVKFLLSLEYKILKENMEKQKNYVGLKFRAIDRLTSCDRSLSVINSGLSVRLHHLV